MTSAEFEHRINRLGGWAASGAFISALCGTGYPAVWGWIGIMLCWYGVKKQRAPVAFSALAVGFVAMLFKQIELTGWIIQGGLVFQLCLEIYQANKARKAEASE